MLPLEEADITEVYDHYILEVNKYERKFELYDGSKHQILELTPDEKLVVSQNQKFMLKYKLKENKLSNQYFFEVEILNTSNEILSKGIIPAVGEDNYESHDDLYPFNNGKGLVIRSEYPDMLTVYTTDKNKFFVTGTIYNPNKILSYFKMTDDASDIICLYYDENEEKSYLDNHQLSNGKVKKKWEKITGGKQAQFSQFSGWFINYLGNSPSIDLVTASQDHIDNMEVYNLDGDLILSRKISYCNEFESNLEGNKITYIGIGNEYIQYLNKKDEVQTVDLKLLFRMDSTLNVRCHNCISTNENIICVFSVIPHYTHKEYLTGLYSGIGILPKSDISKGKYYLVFKNSGLELIVKKDTLYLLKGYRTLYPELIKKIRLPITF